MSWLSARIKERAENNEKPTFIVSYHDPDLFVALAMQAKMIVRTGAIDPWGNVALVSGVDDAIYFANPELGMTEKFRQLVERPKFIPGVGKRTF